MQEYKVKRTSVAISIGIFSALLAAVAGMFIALSQLGAMEIKPSGYWVVRWLTPLVCSFLIPGIVNIIRSFRSYKVDAQTISRKGLFKETTLRWNEIDDYEQSSVSLRLKDASGQEIWLSRFEPKFAEISDEFDQRLAPIKRRMFTRWRNEGATLLFDFRQFLGAGLLFTPALMILFDYATLPFIGNMREVAGLILAFSLMLPGILAFALPCFYPLYIRLLPDSIESFQVWTGRRRFQFKSIVSIINGGITSGADISTVLKDANGKRIYLPTSALQSNLVTEYLRERIDKETVAQGRQEFASERIVLYRKRLVSFFGGTLLLFVMFTGGVYIQSARRMQELGMIKQHGETAPSWPGRG